MTISVKHLPKKLLEYGYNTKIIEHFSPNNLGQNETIAYALSFCAGNGAKVDSYNSLLNKPSRRWLI